MKDLCRFARRVLFLLGSAGATGAALAQTNAPQNRPVPVSRKPGDTVASLQDVPTIRPDQAVNISQLLSEAKQKGKSGDINGAEQKLTSINISKPGTAEWHLETTQRLMQLAEQLAREGSASSVSAIVTSSLQHLDQAATQAKADNDPFGQARAKSDAGLLYDRYRGDPVSAIANYQAALLLRPDDKATQDALERLQKSYANLLARTKPAKKPAGP